MDLTRGPEKKETFRWGEDPERAFQALKEKVCETPVLAMPDVQKPFEIETDASAHALGAVLWQDGRVVNSVSKGSMVTSQRYGKFANERRSKVRASGTRTMNLNYEAGLSTLLGNTSQSRAKLLNDERRSNPATDFSYFYSGTKRVPAEGKDSVGALLNRLIFLIYDTKP